MARKKYVSILTRGILHEFGNIQGPITYPQWLDMDTIRTLLINKRDVYEHYLTDPDRKVKLTLKNYKGYLPSSGGGGAYDPGKDYNVTIQDSPGSETDMTPEYLYIELID